MFHECERQKSRRNAGLTISVRESLTDRGKVRRYKTPESHRRIGARAFRLKRLWNQGEDGSV
jgi:hypothetical protein